jgi:WD40 repeat protein
VPISGQSIFSLACSPNDADVVVIGYQSGNIAIVNVSTGEVVQRLVGHVDEIHAIDWAPATKPQTDEGEESKPDEGTSTSLYLLTSSKDKTIRVWDAADFSLVTTLQIPKPTGQYHEGQKTRVWITACFSPTSPHTIISSNLVYVIATFSI